MVWLILLGIVLLVGLLAAGAWAWSKKKEKDEPLTFRHAANIAKAALIDKENKPEIVKRKKGQEPIAYNAMEVNKAKAEIPGTFVLSWPSIEIIYSCKQPAEQMVLKPTGYDENAVAIFHEGNLSVVEVAGQALDMEDFEMRHAGTISEQLRMFIRYHLRFPGGTLLIDKAPEPTFKPTLDLRKAGEIKLHGKPPPGKLPNFQDE